MLFTFDDILVKLKSTRVTISCQIGQYTIRTSAKQLFAQFVTNILIRNEMLLA